MPIIGNSIEQEDFKDDDDGLTHAQKTILKWHLYFERQRLIKMFTEKNKEPE